MIDVLVESNWLVEVCSPAFRRSPLALDLLDRAAHNDMAIHVPHICFREAKAAVLRKHQPKEYDLLQQFRKWATAHEMIDEATSTAANVLLRKFSDSVTAELTNIDRRLTEIQTARGVSVFALNDQMLQRSISLRVEVPDPLKPFDEAVFAAVLVRAATLDPNGRRIFCTLDSDLSPIKRKGGFKQHLKAVYDAARIEVRASFDLSDVLPPLANRSS